MQTLQNRENPNRETLPEHEDLTVQTHKTDQTV
jgi:hypothetical protein